MNARQLETAFHTFSPPVGSSRHRLSDLCPATAGRHEYLSIEAYLYGTNAIIRVLVNGALQAMIVPDVAVQYHARLDYPVPVEIAGDSIELEIVRPTAADCPVTIMVAWLRDERTAPPASAGLRQARKAAR